MAHTLSIKDRFIVGRKVIPYSIRKCGMCSTWFKFRYDEAVREIREHGYFILICPDCESEFTYEREMHLPNENMQFFEID